MGKTPVTKVVWLHFLHGRVKMLKALPISLTWIILVASLWFDDLWFADRQIYCAGECD